MVLYTLKHKDKVAIKQVTFRGGNEMNKTKWIVGLSIASIIALSGTVFAMNSRTVVARSVGQTPRISLAVYKPSNLETAGNYPSPSPDNNNSNNFNTPGLYGYGRGYGMMGGYGANGYSGGYGMMGSYGMMGGYDYGNGSNYSQNIKDGNSAATDMDASLAKATVDKDANTIAYTGTDVNIVMFGGPEEADGKFVIGGLVNPTLKIPQGANVTLELINEDTGMPHGVEVTTASPPYYFMTMMQGGVYPGSFIPPIPEAANNQYPSAQISFTASTTGQFYYICQYPGHAAKGMYGKIIIS